MTDVRDREARVETNAPEAENRSRTSLVERAFAPLRRRKTQEIVPVARDVDPFSDDDVAVEPKRQVNYVLWSLIIVVLAPLFISGVYLFFIASDQYGADMRFAVRRVDTSPDTQTGSDVPDDTGGSTTGMAKLLGGTQLAGQDAEIVASYIQSRDAINDVSRTLNVRAIFQRPEADFWARLPQDASIEDFSKYWNNQIHVYVEPTSGIVDVTVSTFRREDSLVLAKAILASSEALVNTLSLKVRTDLTTLAEGELLHSENEVRTAIANMTVFRDTHELIDPKTTADSTTTLMYQLIANKIQTEGQLFVAERTGTPNAPGIGAVRAQLESLNNHIADLQQQLAGQKKISKNMAATIAEFESLDLKRQFAEKLYGLAQAGVETARLAALRQMLYLAIFVPPSLPEDYMYPQRMTDFSLIGLFCLMAWVTGATIVASVLDHRI